MHSVASDAHAATGRPPGLQGGIDAAARHLPGVARQARWLTHDAPAAILAGEALPERPERSASGTAKLRAAWATDPAWTR